MSSWWERLNASAVAALGCPYCAESAGYPCVTKSGVKARLPHWLRVGPLYRAWRDGVEAGEGDVLDSAIDNPDWFASRVERRRKERES